MIARRLHPLLSDAGAAYTFPVPVLTPSADEAVLNDRAVLASPEGRWQVGFALGMAAAAGLLMLLAGAIAAPVLLSFALMAGPGLIGAAWRPKAGERFALIGLWALGAVLAGAVTGGLGGPLAVWCLAPLAAALALGGSWRGGAGLSLAAVLLLGLVSALGLAGASALEPGRSWIALIAVTAMALAFAGAAALVLRRAEEGRLPVGQPPALALVQPVAAPSADMEQRLAAAESARREAEIGREKAEADADARARFLANMSHELRTPLNAIMGFSDIMRAKMFGDLAPKYAEYAGLIHESGGHLLDLINDVLDMSKLEAKRYELSHEVLDAREALNAALRIMRLQADDAGVKLRAVLPPDPLMVDADRRALKQIVLNLLSNAVKFTPRAGTVILTAKAVGGALELVVADTGMGIADADLKRIGQPYEQAGEASDRARGTGLGLSLVDALAQLHGGAMTIESRLGEGTAVTVRLPVLVAATALEPGLLGAKA